MRMLNCMQARRFGLAALTFMVASGPSMAQMDLSGYWRQTGQQDSRDNPQIGEIDFTQTFFDQRFEGEETYVAVVPFLSVYDDDAAREMFGDEDWSESLEELTGNVGYIAQFADRIHFNRYTGVAMK